MRVLVEFCRSGLHKMAGNNLLWHTRYDRATGAKTLKRECRACANARYRTKRQAVSRNRKLEQEALASIREGDRAEGGTPLYREGHRGVPLCNNNRGEPRLG